ncbi:glycosyl hydrolase family 28-related protein [Paenibacillus oceani]|uniref:Rhamnogalacturonase A/B/Epimerase-like pectate lyase domain-containing protein n=1 Tax=Paenibacillus oceani TaxID=2772510 RepID=A0A927C925_9BACL|nr:glycosyl hydrolase family 28-related protein [Paenibacillus oceani]MBD2862317.1 hypothetical protein [Paenibacillus oceani]
MNQSDGEANPSISRRKLVATLGATGAALAAGGIWQAFNGNASVVESVYGTSATVDAQEVSFRYAEGLPERTVAQKLRERVSVLDFGAEGNGTSSDSAAIQAAIDFLAGLGGGGVYFPKGEYRLTAALQLPSRITLYAEPGTARMIVSGTGLKVPLLTTAHCETDFTVFATDIHLYGLDFVNDLTLSPGSYFDTYCAWHCANVKHVSMQRCTSHNMGLQYMTHAVRYWGNYWQLLLNNTNPDIDPAVTAGLSPIGGDLNASFLFAENETVVQEQALLQMFRYEFCEYGLIRDNTSVRGAISGWGGSAVIDEGGNLQHYRRCRHVNRVNNRLYEPNALYIINGYMCNDIGNYVERGIDLGIDFEGCFYCTAANNTVKNTGNGSLATFYASIGNKFIGNTCMEDGSAKNINDVFHLGSKWDPSSGNTLIVNKGTGFTNRPGSDECVFAGNELTWLGQEGAGIINVGDFSHYTFRGNKLMNVVFDMNFNNSGNSLISHNEFHITQDVKLDIIDIGDLSGTAAEWTTIEYNTFYVKAKQSAGTSVINLFNNAGQPVKTVIAGNRIYDKNNNIDNDIAYEGASTGASTIHVLIMKQNLMKKLHHKSAKRARILLQLEGNFGLNGKSFPSGDGPPIIDQLGDGVQLASGTKFPYGNLEGKTSEGLIAIHDGFLLADAQQRQASTAYAQGDVVWATVISVDKAYFCVTAGTTGPGGFPGDEETSITDGTAVWRYIGRRQVMAEYGALSF